MRLRIVMARRMVRILCCLGILCGCTSCMIPAYGEQNRHEIGKPHGDYPPMVLLEFKDINKNVWLTGWDGKPVVFAQQPGADPHKELGITSYILNGDNKITVGRNIIEVRGQRLYVNEKKRMDITDITVDPQGRTVNWPPIPP